MNIRLHRRPAAERKHSSRLLPSLGSVGTSLFRTWPWAATRAVPPPMQNARSSIFRSMRMQGFDMKNFINRIALPLLSTPVVAVAHCTSSLKKYLGQMLPGPPVPPNAHRRHLNGTINSLAPSFPLCYYIKLTIRRRTKWIGCSPRKSGHLAPSSR